MNHFYEKIHGWFNYQNIYSGAISRCPSGSHFVEVGSWLGKSAAYMAVEIINSNKKIKFDCVDAWQYLGEEVDGIPTEEHTKAYQYPSRDLYQSFLENMRPVKHVVNPIRSLSVEAAKHYENESLDFIFIDGTHIYEDVNKDLNAWYPKLKKDGIISGHDWPRRGVKKAVTEFFGERVQGVICRGAVNPGWKRSVWIVAPDKEWWLAKEG